jgi:hypothetical protein
MRGDIQQIGAVMKIFLAVITFLTLSVNASADTLIKLESHTDDYYYGGRVHAAVDQETDTWFGDGTMSIATEARMFIFDLHESRLTFVNFDDSTYVETPLPLDWAACADERALSILDRYQRFGTVEKTNKSEEIDGHVCDVYSIESWINTDDGRYSEREMTMWVSKEAALNWDTYMRFLPNLWKLQNYQQEFANEWNRVIGVPLRTETKTYVKGFAVNSYERVVEIKEAEAPDNAYSPPPGFTKKDRISMRDLRG